MHFTAIQLGPWFDRYRQSVAVNPWHLKGFKGTARFAIIAGPCTTIHKSANALTIEQVALTQPHKIYAKIENQVSYDLEPHCSIRACRIKQQQHQRGRPC